MPRHLEPQPGDIMLSRIEGVTGFAVSLGQLLIGDASRYTHCGIVVDNGHIVEAEPGGARLNTVEFYKARGAVFTTGKIPMTDEQRLTIVTEATGLLGTPYSYLDYVALSLHRAGLHWAVIENEITTSDHMICSQLVDEVYRRAGIHLFSDDRLPQDVSPGEIANVLIEEW